MSTFQNYDNFPSQQGPQDNGAAGGPAPVQQPDVAMGGQIPTNAGGQFDAAGTTQQMPGGQPQDGDSKTTLWMGELEPWMDEGFIHNVWYQLGESVNVKMIRDKFSG